MSFHDPKAKELGMRGFWDPKNLDSCIRAVREDSGSRLYDSIRVSKGELNPLHASTEHRIHSAILMQHMHIAPFASVAHLHAFVYEYARKLTWQEKEKQQCILQLMHHWLGMVPRGVLEVAGILPVVADPFGHSDFAEIPDLLETCDHLNRLYGRGDVKSIEVDGHDVKVTRVPYNCKPEIRRATILDKGRVRFLGHVAKVLTLEQRCAKIRNAKPRTMIDASERNARRLRAAGLEPNEFHRLP